MISTQANMKTSWSHGTTEQQELAVSLFYAIERAKFESDPSIEKSVKRSKYNNVYDMVFHIDQEAISSTDADVPLPYRVDRNNWVIGDGSGYIADGDADGDGIHIMGEGEEEGGLGTNLGLELGLSIVKEHTLNPLLNQRQTQIQTVEDADEDKDKNQTKATST